MTPSLIFLYIATTLVLAIPGVISLYKAASSIDTDLNVRILYYISGIVLIFAAVWWVVTIFSSINGTTSPVKVSIQQQQSTSDLIVAPVVSASTDQQKLNKTKEDQKKMLNDFDIPR